VAAGHSGEEDTMVELLQKAFGIEPIDRVTFTRAGLRGVGVKWEGPDGAGEGQWCYIEPLHNTPEAIETARVKADLTRQALQAAYDAERAAR
jgi:hypothetical protein